MPDVRFFFCVQLEVALLPYERLLLSVGGVERGDAAEEVTAPALGDAPAVDATAAAGG